MKIISQTTPITSVRSLFVRWDRRPAGLLFNNLTSTEPNCIFLCQLEIIKKTGGTPVLPNQIPKKYVHISLPSHQSDHFLSGGTGVSPVLINLNAVISLGVGNSKKTGGTLVPPD